MLPSELIPAAAYQITPFPFSFHQYHTQTDMDLVWGMAFAFEVLFKFFSPLHHAFSTNRKFRFRNEFHLVAEHVTATLLISSVIGTF